MRQPPPRISTSRVDAWLGALRVDQAVRQRVGAAWELRAAGPETSLGGVLADLAERQARVSVELAGGRWRHGCLIALGADACALDDGRATTLVALAAVRAVRTPGGEAPSVGRAAPANELPALRDVLDALAATGVEVLLQVGDDGSRHRGELAVVGEDVIALRIRPDAGSVGEGPAAAAGGWTYLPLASLAEVSVVGSG